MKGHSYEELKKIAFDDLEYYMMNIYSFGRRRGYEEGQKYASKCIQKTHDQAYVEQIGYMKGMEDAWHLARDIENMSSAQMANIFGEVSQCTIFEKFSPEEAIQKIKDYEERKEAEVKGYKDGLMDATKVLVKTFGDANLRNATPEERMAVNEGIENISTNTGVNFYDDLQEQQEERSCKNCFVDKQNCSFINECIPNNRKYWKTQKWGNHIYEEICLFAEDEGCSIDEISTVLDKMRGDGND